jgi:hypothetical protein
MKIKYINIVILSLVLIFSASDAFADERGPGEPPGGPGTGPPVGGGAPIGGGTLILIGLGAAYGAKKVYNLFEENRESLED